MSKSKKILFFVFFILMTVLLSVIFVVKAQQWKNAKVAEAAPSQIKKEYQYAAPWEKAFFENFYNNLQNVPDDMVEIKGGIVPHHLLTGYIDATFFKNLKKQQPSTIVIFSPNHFSRGRGDIITTNLDWKTVFGEVENDTKIIKKLSKNGIVNIDEVVIKEEHGVYGLIPFIAKSLPDAKVLSFAFKNDISTSTQNVFLAELKKLVPKDTVFVASIDFSHYQTSPVADFHDELSKNVIKTFDYARLSKLEIDSVPSLYALLKIMETYGTQKVAYEMHMSSAKLVSDLQMENVTSYYSPYFVKGEPEKESKISLLFFGDMMLDRLVKKKIDAYGADYILEKLAGEENRFFQGMDIVTANLEGPFVKSRRKTTKEIAFAFDPVLLPMLKKYNFSLFSQANNHTMDMTKKGVEESQKYLNEAGFDWYGSQYDIDDKSMITKEIGNKKVAFIGVNDTNTYIDLDKTKELIEKMNKEVDFVIMSIHWGIEYKNTSSVRQRDLAHEFIDVGADAVIGGHPHVTQEMEIYKDRPIFYSLGNFVFDQYFSEATQQGLGVGLILSDDNISVYLFPLQSVQSQVDLVGYEKAKKIIDGMIDKSRLNGYNYNNFNINLAF